MGICVLTTVKLLHCSISQCREWKFQEKLQLVVHELGLS
jgi:hypothetical protein